MLYFYLENKVIDLNIQNLIESMVLGVCTHAGR